MLKQQIELVYSLLQQVKHQIHHQAMSPSQTLSFIEKLRTFQFFIRLVSENKEILAIQAEEDRYFENQKASFFLDNDSIDFFNNCIPYKQQSQQSKGQSGESVDFYQLRQQASHLQSQNDVKIECHEDEENSKQDRGARGPYRNYTLQEKMQVLQMRRSGMSARSICRTLGIPQKNIVRWCNTGIVRKQGAGRKVADAQMEQKVLKWMNAKYKPNECIKSKDIRIVAKKFTENKNFKSSKGWCKNFIKRLQLDKKFQII